MPLFEQTIPIKYETVAELVKLNWNLELQTLIKASQNHTFNAKDNNNIKYAVRVTPDPKHKHLQRIKDELFFVDFISNSGLFHVCKPIHTISDKENFIIEQDDIIIVVFEWAHGNPLDFMSFRWMLDKTVVNAWGKWFAEFHLISKSFCQLYPEVFGRIQQWNEIHNGVLSKALIDQQDLDVVGDLNHFGVIHGDLNCGNFFYVEDTTSLSVFDWDQCQRGWYLWDVAQAQFTVVMLAEAGLPIAGTPVPDANPVQFEEWIIEGYESVAGRGSVDRERYSRMIGLRKTFYETFCRQAKEEGDVPPDMAAFINYIVDWFDKSNGVASAINIDDTSQVKDPGA
jgi:Ser/Thr protein kinase RdoA (MazF antagonist)